MVEKKPGAVDPHGLPEVEDPVMETFADPFYERIREWLLHFNLEHLHGPEKIEYGTDELVVLCMVRDGQPYMRSFIEHYMSLGVKHIVFLDNGSEDDTVSIASEYDQVTVLRSRLPFKRYRIAMKRYLIKRFATERWSLCVDVDELFDFPHSDIVSLEALLGYLNRGSYTAVVAHMLDMFKEEAVSSAVDEEEGSLKVRYRFYDVSDVKRTDYQVTTGSDNEISNKALEVFRGGIQKTLFEHLGLLTKHPLVFYNEEMRLMERSAHWVSGARVADFTCVLFHYKFLDGYFRKSVAQAIREENRAYNSMRYKMYSEALEREQNLLIKQETSKELKDVNDLISNQFLLVSGGYMLLVDQADKSSEGEILQSRRRRLIETFSGIRGTTESQVAEVEQLEKRAEELDRELNKERHRAETQRQRNLVLSERVLRLQQSLESIKSSRGWKIIERVERIRNKVLKR